MPPLQAGVTIVRKKTKLDIPKTLSVSKSWKLIGPIIETEMGGVEYTAIPNCFDTNAYKIGNIFVTVTTERWCFSTTPTVQVLGPIRDFIDKGKTNPKWLAKEFHVKRVAGDQKDFQISLAQSANKLSFKGLNCSTVSKTNDMMAMDGVYINRNSHEALAHAKWFGLITGAIVAKCFELNINRKEQSRTLHIADSEHTILFNYEICKINEEGKVISTSMEKLKSAKWIPVTPVNEDQLPLPDLNTSCGQ